MGIIMNGVARLKEQTTLQAHRILRNPETARVQALVQKIMEEHFLPLLSDSEQALVTFRQQLPQPPFS